MADASLRPTQRFSDRVADYVRYRPGYPDEVIRTLRNEAGLDSDSVVADVGSGTGISSELFLSVGCTVHAVEPNDEMRLAGEDRHAGNPRHHSVAGTAEVTGLTDRSVDFVAAGQAFHWFDASRARVEFLRILRREGHAVLFWNDRRIGSTPFHRDYEAILQRFATDYRKVRQNKSDAAIATLFGSPFRKWSFYNEQQLDLAAFRGRIRSSSYSLAKGHPDHDAMLSELDRVFREHEETGLVRIEYDCEIFLGHLTP